MVDVNRSKKAWADKFGATDVVNPVSLEGLTIQEKLIEMTDGGCDYTFDCTGYVGVMRAALEAYHKGWGQSIVIGVAAAGQEISTRRKPMMERPNRQRLLSSLAFQLVTGRVWKGRYVLVLLQAYHQLPDLVDDYMQGKVDEFITHRKRLADINQAFDVMKQGDCIRCVVKMA